MTTLEAEVLVYKDDAKGGTRRVYRQSWAGQVRVDFNLMADHHLQNRLIVLEQCKPSGGHVLIRLGGSHATHDFSIEHISSPWVLGNRLLAHGVPREIARRFGFLLPLPDDAEVFSADRAQSLARLQAAPSLPLPLRGKTRLPVPYTPGRGRSVTSCSSEAFRILATIRSDRGAAPVFISQQRTHKFIVFPVLPTRKGPFNLQKDDFDVHYLLQDQGDCLRIVNSWCRQGYTGFGVTSAPNEQQAVDMLLERGVSQGWISAANLWTYPPRLDAERQAVEMLEKLRDKKAMAPK